MACDPSRSHLIRRLGHLCVATAIASILHRGKHGSACPSDSRPVVFYRLFCAERIGQYQSEAGGRGEEGWHGWKGGERNTYHRFSAMPVRFEEPPAMPSLRDGSAEGRHLNRR
jgi:hypothetical protein